METNAPSVPAHYQLDERGEPELSVRLEDLGPVYDQSGQEDTGILVSVATAKLLMESSHPHGHCIRRC